jgi:hypothetical protein
MDDVDGTIKSHPNDYPDITFWYKHQQEKEFKARGDLRKTGQRGPGRSSNGENVAFWFLQNEDRTVVDVHILTNI